MSLRSIMAVPNGPNSPGLQQVEGQFLKSIWIDDESGIIYADTVPINTPGTGGGGSPGGATNSIQINNGDGTFAGSIWTAAGNGLFCQDDNAQINAQSQDGNSGFFANLADMGVFGNGFETDLVCSQPNAGDAPNVSNFLNVFFGGGNIGCFAGPGSPVGIISGGLGSLFLRSDGADASNTLYVNVVDAGWIALGGGGGLTAPWSQTGPTIQVADDSASLSVSNTAADSSVGIGPTGIGVNDDTGGATLTTAVIRVHLVDNTKQFVASLIDGVEVIGIPLDLSSASGLVDSLGSPGVNTQLLSSTSTGVKWVDSSGGSFPTLNQVSNPTATKNFTLPQTANFIISGTQPDSVSSGDGTNAGTPLLLTGYTGGATTDTGTTAGIGSSSQFSFGDGGDASGGTDAKGGLGGSFAITTGSGGASSGSADNANGGDIVFQFGTAGNGGAGAIGRDGKFIVQGSMEVDGGIIASSSAPPDQTGTGTNGFGISLSASEGGASTGTATTAGDGGTWTAVSGPGGAGTGTDTIGGNGGDYNFYTGGGGSSTGTAVNSHGGDFTIHLGAPGTGGSGTAGRGGQFTLMDALGATIILNGFGNVDLTSAPGSQMDISTSDAILSLDTSGTGYIRSNGNHKFLNNIILPSDAIITSGAGSPEGVVTGKIGSLYLRSNGAAGTTLYVKNSGTGNTGWSSNLASAGGTTGQMQYNNAGALAGSNFIVDTDSIIIQGDDVGFEMLNAAPSAGIIMAVTAGVPKFVLFGATELNDSTLSAGVAGQFLSSGGAGAGVTWTDPTILQSTTTITSAQIKTLASVPAILSISAPGVGKFIRVESAVFQYVFGTIPYTVDPSATIVIDYDASGMQATVPFGEGGIIDQSNNVIFTANPNNNGSNQTFYENLALTVRNEGSVTDATLGDGTLVVTVRYYIQSC